MDPKVFLLLNLALNFYNVGTIWAHEIDIFRSWKLLDPRNFHAVQRVHWRKLPYWVLAPVGLSLLGSIVLIRYHPGNSPRWGVAGVVLCQVLSIVLTAGYWGRWQAPLAQDPASSASPYLAKILNTHCVRTLLVNANALLLLFGPTPLFNDALSRRSDYSSLTASPPPVGLRIFQPIARRARRAP